MGLAPLVVLPVAVALPCCTCPPAPPELRSTLPMSWLRSDLPESWLSLGLVRFPSSSPSGGRSEIAPGMLLVRIVAWIAAGEQRGRPRDGGLAVSCDP